jgi:hypothetical protein
MRVTAFAMALMLGGAAIAQTTNPHAGHSVNADGTMSTSASSQAGSTSVDAAASVDVDPSADAGTSWNSNQTSTTTSSNTTSSWNGQTTASNMASGQMVQPSNANPETDARGIRVISHPAMAPAGYNGGAGTAMGGPLLDPATGQAMGAPTYPACSASVTDNCVQTYERGRRR